jgi:hypothetical protein
LRRSDGGNKLEFSIGSAELQDYFVIDYQICLITTNAFASIVKREYLLTLEGDAHPAKLYAACLLVTMFQVG